jgi:hypothetical protein
MAQQYGHGELIAVVEAPADCMADKDYTATPDGFMSSNHLASSKSTSGSLSSILIP